MCNFRQKDRIFCCLYALAIPFYAALCESNSTTTTSFMQSQCKKQVLWICLIHCSLGPSLKEGTYKPALDNCRRPSIWQQTAQPNNRVWPPAHIPQNICWACYRLQIPVRGHRSCRQTRGMTGYIKLFLSTSRTADFFICLYMQLRDWIDKVLPETSLAKLLAKYGYFPSAYPFEILAVAIFSPCSSCQTGKLRLPICTLLWIFALSWRVKKFLQVAGMLTDTAWEELLTRLGAFIAQAQQGYWKKRKEDKCQTRDASEALEVSPLQTVYNKD